MPQDKKRKASDKRVPRSPARGPTEEQRENIIKRRRLEEDVTTATSKPSDTEGNTEPIPADKGEGASSSSSAPKATEGAQAPIPAPNVQKTMPPSTHCIPDRAPPRMYGYWCHGRGGKDGKPWALVLFSGKSRAGDLQHQLCALGWRVCAVDTVAPKETNLLCESTWESIRADITLGKFEALWIATPCETFSPLREKQPGPRVLRTLEHIEGLPRAQLSQAEQKQVKEANILVHRSTSAAAAQASVDKPFGIENPDHDPSKPSLWMMPQMVKIINEKADGDIRFDQCRTGLETRKPTRLVTKKIDLSELHNQRCNHEPKEYTRPDGSKYRSAHESTVQRWKLNEDGTRERASKSQGQYTAEFSSAIARAFHRTQAGAPWLKEDLAGADLP